MLFKIALIASCICLYSSTLSFADEPSERFKRLDKNGDGKLTHDEAAGGLFERVDKNGDGVVTPKEDNEFRVQRGKRTLSRDALAVKSLLDLKYASTENPRQRLDLYLPRKPKGDGKLPVVVFIHGGGWSKGDKRAGRGLLQPLVASGEYAGVSVGYRLSDEAVWPAQIHDCKAAIRWIRANSAKHGLDPDRIGVTGTSAGGHLASMLGTSGDVAELEGTLGKHTKMSSRVRCVASQFGPTDFLALRGYRDVSKSAEARLIGGPVDEMKDLSKKASPIHYVSADDPPFLFLHGTEDRLVPLDQSSRLHKSLGKSGIASELIPFTGARHGNLPREAVQRHLRDFFEKYLVQ